MWLGCLHFPSLCTLPWVIRSLEWFIASKIRRLWPCNFAPCKNYVRSLYGPKLVGFMVDCCCGIGWWGWFYFPSIFVVTCAKNMQTLYLQKVDGCGPNLLHHGRTVSGQLVDQIWWHYIWLLQSYWVARMLSYAFCIDNLKWDDHFAVFKNEEAWVAKKRYFVNCSCLSSPTYAQQKKTCWNLHSSS